jgi:hypothetical protein
VIHVSDFISERIGWIRLTPEQILDQNQPQLAAFEARTIIYLGKASGGSWWDLNQLIDQVKIMISIFQVTHPNCIGIFVFDRSSAHEGFAENALNVNVMNKNPGGKQKMLHNTVIPLSNPDPVPREEDTCEKVQKMSYPDDHHDPNLWEKPKKRGSGLKGAQVSLG